MNTKLIPLDDGRFEIQFNDTVFVRSTPDALIDALESLALEMRGLVALRELEASDA